MCFLRRRSSPELGGLRGRKGLRKGWWRETERRVCVVEGPLPSCLLMRSAQVWVVGVGPAWLVEGEWKMEMERELWKRYVCVLSLSL